MERGQSVMTSAFDHPVKRDQWGNLSVTIDDTEYSLSQHYALELFVVRSLTPVELPAGGRKLMSLRREIDALRLREENHDEDIELEALKRGILYLQPQIAAKHREILGVDHLQPDEAIDHEIARRALEAEERERKDRERSQAEEAARKQRDQEELEALPGYGTF